MMLQWGTKLADHMFLPIWVTATPADQRLYEKFDFHKHEGKDTASGNTAMYRKARGPSHEL